MTFIVVNKKSDAPYTPNTAILCKNNWNDFGFETTFYLFVNNNTGNRIDIGAVKIAKIGQLRWSEDLSQENSSLYKTRAFIPSRFESLNDDFFSLGQEIDFYKNLQKLDVDLKHRILTSLNDVSFNKEILEEAKKEDVFKDSLLRDVPFNLIQGQFKRILDGEPPLTDFNLSFKKKGVNSETSPAFTFNVQANSTPSTNIHAIIGKNGSGKTTILNNMVQSLVNNTGSEWQFLENSSFISDPISTNYFTALVSVSFSAFDTFTPPKNQSDPTEGMIYYYIGLKHQTKKGLKDLSELRKECAESIIDCFNNLSKAKQWLQAIKTISSDDIFSEMNLDSIYENYNKGTISNEAKILELIDNMSSGHSIILLTLSKLVATVEEKTLVLIDEPETHLHPPLLSSFIRALNNLLYAKNGVAVIATHSPVVLQEIPSSCVTKINRYGDIINVSDPHIETFAENVGTLTREIFTLEMSKSGFNALLKKSAKSGKSYEEILEEYGNQIGIEGRIILKNAIARQQQ